ncbi:AtpZ/AtpI family protein [Candidatus Raskinella chloraquaticus]|uniref:F0F1 ATP synthase assembly protein I n=1 Tax=Candidatus Raskinella chloraquaticus TaxID=1951219 RepID=A0A1W9HW03_9HYPH|nr:MAG: F0F1 ATP synthase assembly protein I [Proteobacteria bacterium SG_bin8]
MTDGTGGNDRSGKPQGKPSADETALSERLTRLNQQLSDVRKSRGEQAGRSDEQGNPTASASAMARGFRLSSELVAGVIVGGVIGWGFDYLLSTSPWGLIVFFLLGFAAGVINVMRAAGVAPERTLD